MLNISNAMADDAKTSDVTDTPDYNNWLTLGGGGTMVREGDSGQFRSSVNKSPPTRSLAGWKNFHIEQYLNKKTLLQFDGRGIYDNNDFDVDFSVVNPDVGYVRSGYKEFRTWYDDSGGFFPLGKTNWITPANDELHVDRGDAWFETGLTLPNLPVIALRYDHETRAGEKDSTG